MNTYQEELQALNALLFNRLNSWFVEKISLQVCPILDSDATDEINLVDTLGFGKRIVNPDIPDDKVNSIYWLPSLFSVNTPEFRSNKVAPFFVHPCRDAGFNVRLKGWEASRSSLRFICQRGRKYQNYLSKKRAAEKAEKPTLTNPPPGSSSMQVPSAAVTTTSNKQKSKGRKGRSRPGKMPGDNAIRSTTQPVSLFS